MDLPGRSAPAPACSNRGAVLRVALVWPGGDGPARCVTLSRSSLTGRCGACDCMKLRHRAVQVLAARAPAVRRHRLVGDRALEARILRGLQERVHRAHAHVEVVGVGVADVDVQLVVDQRARAWPTASAAGSAGRNAASSTSATSWSMAPRALVPDALRIAVRADRSPGGFPDVPLAAGARVVAHRQLVVVLVLHHRLDVAVGLARVHALHLHPALVEVVRVGVVVDVDHLVMAEIQRVRAHREACRRSSADGTAAAPPRSSRRWSRR